MGIFITFEGGEGSGKSTQAMLLTKRLKTLGYNVILTREPGGTDLGEKLRDIVVKGNMQLSSYTELLIFMAARADHWEKCIKPALEADAIVICDRFQLSTIVYQCICGNCKVEFADEIYKKVIGNLTPTCTFIIDIDPKIGLARSKNRPGNDELRFENKDLSFHYKVRKSYLSLAELYNLDVLDGTQDVGSLHEKILLKVNKILNFRAP